MSSPQIFDQGNEYWFWGNRCDKVNEYNKAYFMCYKGSKEYCTVLKKLETERKADILNGSSK